METKKKGAIGLALPAIHRVALFAGLVCKSGPVGVNPEMLDTLLGRQGLHAHKKCENRSNT